MVCPKIADNWCIDEAGWRLPYEANSEIPVIIATDDNMTLELQEVVIKPQ